MTKQGSLTLPKITLAHQQWIQSKEIPDLPEKELRGLVINLIRRAPEKDEAHVSKFKK